MPLWMVAPLFLFGGLLALYGAVRQFRNEQAFLGAAIRTQGVIENFSVSAGPRSARYPIVRFTTLSGVTLAATSNVGGTGFRLGKEVSVLYDPSDPNEMQVDVWWARHGGSMGIAFFGLLFLTIGVYATLSLLGVTL